MTENKQVATFLGTGCGCILILLLIALSFASIILGIALVAGGF